MITTWTRHRDGRTPNRILGANPARTSPSGMDGSPASQGTFLGSLVPHAYVGVDLIITCARPHHLEPSSNVEPYEFARSTSTSTRLDPDDGTRPRKFPYKILSARVACALARRNHVPDTTYNLETFHQVRSWVRWYLSPHHN